MSEEIKEILRNCEKAINDASGYNDTTNKILDYMTNLQQKVEQKDKEIDRLKNQIAKLNEQVSQYQDEIFARDNNWYDMQD